MKLASQSDEVDRLVAEWQRERPDVDTAPLQVLSRVTRLARHLDRERRTAFAAHELEHWSFDVLAALRRAGAPVRAHPRQPASPDARHLGCHDEPARPAGGCRVRAASARPGRPQGRARAPDAGGQAARGRLPGGPRRPRVAVPRTTRCGGPAPPGGSARGGCSSTSTVPSSAPVADRAARSETSRRRSPPRVVGDGRQRYETWLDSACRDGSSLRSAWSRSS